ncbi:MAG: glycosyltransferase family 39 protein [Clostridiaceae bacterium]|nr:glycosyltransferase family 39 protein [Clostridiaceae bacterium]
MNKIAKGFTNFMMIALKILLVVVLVPTIKEVFHQLLGINISFFIVLLLISITIFSTYKITNCKMDNKKKIAIILLIGMVFRILWIINVNSIPTSDFSTMYESAGHFLRGSTSMFKDTAYIARNPHLTIMVIYMAAMRGLFPVSNLLAMKIVNVFLGTLTIYLIYLIIKKIFNNNKYGLYAAAAAAVFPPLVTYIAVFCTENIAMPLYLVSIYLFLLVVKDKKSYWYLILCGITICIGHLFRMVAQIVVIAFVLYILLYCKDKLIHKIRNISIILISFLALFICVSTTLQSMDITQYALWKGAEPNITSILKGTHIASGGAWNEEDAKIPEECNFDYDKITEVCKDTIIERLTTTPPSVLFNFYINKFVHQWDQGDLSGIFWSELDVPKDEILVNITGGGMAICQAIYAVMMILTFIGVFNKKALENNPEVKLFYLLLCGYGAAYLITESQARYSYIVCWLFIILAAVGLDKVYKRK